MCEVNEIPQRQCMFSLSQQAALKFSYCVQDEADSCATGKWTYDDVPMKPFRTVMVIPTDRMGTIMDKMTEYLSV